MNTDHLRHVREFAGVLLKDWWGFSQRLRAGDASYLSICNRTESVEPAPDGSGYRCNWQWASDLHAPKLMPHLGIALMRRALQEHPIGRSSALSALRQDSPQVSFLIGHRGTARVPHLMATLESIAGQRGAALECIVVEQDAQRLLAGKLPTWVRHVHTPLPYPGMPYCRAWALNVAARHARGSVLVLHDNDMLVPVDYAAHVLRRIGQGYEVVNLKRFIFYLTQAHTDDFLKRQVGLLDAAPDVVVQNLEAGGSVAITRGGFDRIGGMDESFVGWGGEDNEFWDRAQTLRTWNWGGLPIVHLWHAAQAGKHDVRNETAAQYRALAQITPAARIQRLRAEPQGRLSGPAGGRSNVEAARS